MKQIITFLALIFSYMLCGAQATTIVLDNQTPGWLSSKIEYADQQTVENLTVNGYLNPDDLKFIASLIKLNLSGVLDLSKCQIVGSDGKPTNTLERNAIYADGTIKHFITPECLERYGGAEFDIDTLTIGGENMPVIGNAISCQARHLIFREGVEEISNGWKDAYYYYNSLQEDYAVNYIKFPESIRKIGHGAFSLQRYLKEFNLPDGVEFIGKYAFTGTGFNPDTIVIPENLKTFYPHSFNVNKGMTFILGPNVEIFDNSAKGEGESYSHNCNMLSRDYHYNLVINRVIPPAFVSSYGPTSCDLESSTIWVPKEGYSYYKDPNYKVESQRTNAYSYAVIKMIPVPVETVRLSVSSTNLNVGSCLNLYASILPSNADNLGIEWTSSNPNVANVNQEGLVTAQTSGTAIIQAVSAENPKIFATCEITVRQPLHSISLYSKELSLKVGETYTASLAFTPSNADNKSVIWNSSDRSVVDVNSVGVITAICTGASVVTVTSVENTEIKDECVVTVIQPATGLTLNRSSLIITEDESEKLEAIFTPRDASNKSVKWTSSDISVAMVSPDGTVYAIKPGQATIMATSDDGGFVALCKVTVKSKIVMAESLYLSSSNSILSVGETLQLTAAVMPENTTNKSVRWASTNTDVATVNENGLVYAVGGGNAQIIATTLDGSNLSAICEITVENEFTLISQIAVIPASLELGMGETFNLSVEITPEEATSKVVGWSSTDGSVASINSDGLVTANKSGNATIIASTQDGSNLSAMCFVTVKVPAGIQEVEIPGDTCVKIFNLQGILVFDGEYKEASLSSDTYIIVTAERTFKRIIR